MARLESLSTSQARRIALAAQGFNVARPSGLSDRRHVRRVLKTVNLLQIDSVNVLARAHEMPLWSRLGAYRRGVLDDMLQRGEVFEYWAHESSLIPVEDWPLWQRAMQRTDAVGHWSHIHRLEADKPGFVASILRQVGERGAVTASELKEPGRRTGPWWDWNDAKYALEWLFQTGQVTARRRGNFEREYLLAEHAIPHAIRAAPPINEHDARVELLDRGARALGVATERDIADYFRLKPNASKAAFRQLIETGRLLPTTVEGWDKPSYLHVDAKLPRTMRARSLLSPFDPVVWERQRAERLFGFHYRIEIYTPAPKRVYGYYVLPFLLGETIAARVDLKADRKARVLRVPGAFVESGADRDEVAFELGAELQDLRVWLDLDTISVEKRGNLATPLRSALLNSRYEGRRR